MPRVSSQMAGGANVLAFLDMITQSEGTPTVEGIDNGYALSGSGGLHAKRSRASCGEHQ